MLTDKREILHIKSYFSKHANEEIVVEIIEYCIAIFNSAVGKNFLNMQNLKIGFLIWKMVSPYTSGFANNIFHHI